MADNAVLHLSMYFDFRGYSDMAIGAARMFAIVLPLNFFSPYKAKSIQQFWRRWHMTLSRFLREFVYVPLGGNRRSETRINLNLFATFVLGGIWHGGGLDVYPLGRNPWNCLGHRTCVWQIRHSASAYFKLADDVFDSAYCVGFFPIIKLSTSD